MTQTIFMVGARGAGKTTVGSALAKALGYKFVDTDLALLCASGLSVADIVEREALYQESAHHVVDGTQEPQTVVNLILDALALPMAR